MPKYGLIYEIKGPNSLLAGSYQKLAVWPEDNHKQLHSGQVTSGSRLCYTLYGKQCDRLLHE
jgi:hypothetical protein